ncbi:MAG: hypothetical protein OXF83_05535, partial [Anaerolineaceae bacterium]|nr:hypothetical protein [Anaerolineaceae bacterium]
MSDEASLARAFFRVQPLPEAIAQLLERWQPERRATPLATTAALGRTLTTAPLAPEHLPKFARSSMDGFAVR